MVHSFPLIEKARAKINLTLHVGPVSADGYHPIKSLVVFAGIGDVVEMHPAKGNQSTLTIEGSFADGLENDGSNLILKTAELLSPEKFDFKLTKNLPIASGIGGGSADAAATARLIAHATGQDIEKFTDPMLDLGADIPVCVHSQTCLMQGKGEILSHLRGLEEVHAVLVNPGVAVSTGKVFHQFDETDPDAINLFDELAEDAGLLEMAMAGRNDLQDVAISMLPEISPVLKTLNAQQDCQLVRMSGSGATCFGLFPSLETALKAQRKISTQHPDWWCVQTMLGDKV
jgi:4-diphosphocytidyl-2-C-methyl-D-erythritol kinase